MTRRSAILGVAVLWAGAWALNRSLVAVRGSSMLPDLREGARLLTLPARLVRPRPGRVVVVEDPVTPGHLVVKRLARLQGDRVVVLGDHAAASTDSRVWGSLPRSAVRRVALARWPSLRRRGLSRPTPGPTATRDTRSFGGFSKPTSSQR